VVLRSWCVVMCTVCQLVSNWREKIILKLHQVGTSSLLIEISSSFAASLTNCNLTSANSCWQNVRRLQKVTESMEHTFSWRPMWRGRQAVNVETQKIANLGLP
jgi:hypothetical protein